jgi:large subunit ribosomal protein L5
MATDMKPTLKTKYQEVILPQLMDKLNCKNVMQVPRLRKITLNIGAGGATQNSKLVDEAIDTLTLISGQKAVATKSRKAISNFKLREGVPIGAKVTLHGQRMWEFLERLITLALPRVKDFRGISVKSFDGNGNYNLGIKEQIVFLEVDYDKISKINGLDVSIVTSAKNDSDCRELLTMLGMPFRVSTN